MSRHRPAFLVFFLVPLLVAAGDAAPAPEDPHARCDHCHVGSAESTSRPDARCCSNCHWKIVVGKEGISGGSKHLNAGRVDAKEKVDCLSCHRPHPDGTRCRLRIDESLARVSSGELDASSLLCLECHETFLQAEPQQGGDYTLHPVGIAAPRMVDGGPGAPLLPLADIHGTADPGDDIIACTTCHFQHESPNADLLRWGEEAPAEDLVAAGRGS